MVVSPTLIISAIPILYFFDTKTHAVHDHTRMTRNIQGFGDYRPVSTIDRNTVRKGGYTN